MSDTDASGAASSLTLREAAVDDITACAQIVFDAFAGIHDQHSFPRDFPVLDAASAMISMWIAHPSVWGVVAEVDGRIVGSNFLDERGPIRGVGPITVDPRGQNAGVGRELMKAVLQRGEASPGIRLLQDAFNMRSLALYEALAFDVKEPVAVMSGRPRTRAQERLEVRALQVDDLEGCGALCQQVHGFERTGELRDSISTFAPFVGVRDERIVAYASSATFWPMNHGVAESDDDMQALLLGAAAALEDPIALLVPLRGGLFRWGLQQGLRLVKPMNLMAMGEYQEPRGSWFPSVLY